MILSVLLIFVMIVSLFLLFTIGAPIVFALADVAIFIIVFKLLFGRKRRNK